MDSIKEYGIRDTISEMFYFKGKDAVLMYCDLTKTKEPKDLSKEKSIRFLIVNKQNFDSLNLTYMLKNRYLKAVKNLNRGYTGYCIAKGNRVVGDLWTSFRSKPNVEVHPDLRQLAFDINDLEVYGFDMYLAKNERGNSSTASLLLGGMLYDLKQKGFQKVKCYVMSNRIPAMWIHRVFGFKEFGRMGCKRFLVFRKFINKPQVELSGA